ncbi:hypothetical protein AW736_05370 [Termitidicoccus mucosus]|uniref:TonB-dependent receptor plug domain-containing protein n=2 Tax=Termitidicoccus mucosus TaxID=1184151 RepID=A0A178IMF9_9BACT|nr:hypothetical protein AW736_05370 [Opitutaceae bacterium TSB47]
MTMNTRLYARGGTATLLASLLFSAALLAQQVAQPPALAVSGTGAVPVVQRAAPASESDSELVILSPFEVSAEKDVGFVATTSLAGGRLAGDLATTPVAYSVQTREFIDALQLVNFAEALEWAPNTNSARDNGDNEIRSGSGTQVTMRGIAANGVQRNFFPLNVNYDSYNLDRFDYARGPNSVLFGYGSFGGTPNIVTKQALLRKNLAGITAAFSSLSYFRATADVNVPLGRRAAVRVNALWHDSDGWRDFEFEKKKAVDVAGVYRIGKTTIRGEAEVGQVKRNNPPTMAVERFTGWDGHTTYASLLAANPAGATGTGRQQVNKYVYNTALSATQQQAASAVNMVNTGLTVGGRAISGAKGPFGGYLAAAANPFGDWAAPFVGQGSDYPLEIFDVAEANSYFRYPGHTFAIGTSEPTVVQDYKVYTVTVDHQIGRHFFLQLAGNYSDNKYFSKGYMFWRGLYDTYIDINEKLPIKVPVTLPNGTVEERNPDNPNFLQPYNEGARVVNDWDTEQYDVRAAAAYVLNGTRWGNFSVNAMAGKVWQDATSYMYNYAVKADADHREWGKNANAVYYRYYWNERNRPAPDLDGAITDPATGATVPVGWMPDISSPTYQRATKRELTYLQAAFKADVFDNRLHFLAAVRRDNNWQRTRNGDNYYDYDAVNWDGRIQFAPDAPADYFNLTYIPKDGNGNPTGPALPADARPREGNGTPVLRYAGDRFRDDYSPPVVDVNVTTCTVGAVVDILPWMSVSANYGTSYNPNTALQSLFGTLVPPQESSGYDIALRFSLLKKRLTASVLYYEGEDNNQTVGIWTTIENLNRIINAMPRWDGPGQRPPGTGMNERGMTVLSTGLQDIYNRENRGYEFEAVANLTRNWRLTFNAAFPKSYQTNYRAHTRAYMAQNDATLRQILADAGLVVDPLTNVCTVGAGTNTTNSPGHAAAREGWRTLQIELGNFVNGRQLLKGQSKWMANLFTDYTVPSGKLKGLRVGAGVNYRGKRIVGYRGEDEALSDPSDPNSAVINDPSVSAYDPVYSDDYFMTTLTLGYEFKVKRQRVRLDLRVTNLLDHDDPIYYDSVMMAKNRDLSSPVRVMTPAQFYYQNPRTYTLTVSVRH